MPAHRRRKAFGQHFLKDLRVIDRIVSEAHELTRDSAAKTWLEVGPGMGALTDPLLTAYAAIPSLKRFVIVEKDRKFAEHWAKRCTELTPQPEGIEVVQQDFLETPLDPILAGPPVIVISNLPYSVGTAILTRLAEHPSRIAAMVLMFQAEVARRLYASPGNKSWGSLSLWMQNQWDVKSLLKVPPGAFAPPPDVDSEVVTFVPRAEPRVTFAAERAAEWEKLLKTSFLHRRKMLRAGMPKGSRWLAGLAASGIDPTKRAEALTWKEWQAWMDGLKDVE